MNYYNLYNSFISAEMSSSIIFLLLSHIVDY